MSINEEAVAVVQNGAVPMERAQAVQIVHNLSVDGILAPAPQIIRTPADLEALAPDTLVLYFDKSGFGEFWEAHLALYSINHTVGGARLPVVVVASGEHVRACREALEGETT